MRVQIYMNTNGTPTLWSSIPPYGVRDIQHLKVGDTLTIRESKTGKDNVLVINKTVYRSFELSIKYPLVNS